MNGSKNKSVSVRAVAACLLCLEAGAGLDHDPRVNLSYSGVGYLDHEVRENDSLSVLQLNPQDRLKLNDHALLYVSGWLRDEAGAVETTWSRLLETQDRAAVGLREAYLQGDADPFSVRAGKQVFDWSVTDTVSPTDTLNPRDWTDMIEWERIGVPALSVTGGKDTYLQLVAALFSVSRFPSETWTHGLPVEMDEDVQGKPQLASRAAAPFKFGEAGVSAMWGRSYAPQLTLRQDEKARPYLEGDYPEQFASSAFCTLNAPMGWIVRGDAGYFKQVEGDDFTQFVVGAERLLSGLLKETDSLQLIIQYAGEIACDNETPDRVDIQDLRRGLRDSVLWHLTYDPWAKGEFSLQTKGSFNVVEPSSYVEFATAFARGDWETTCGVGFFSGDPDTFWGGVRDHDRLFIRTAYWF